MRRLAKIQQGEEEGRTKKKKKDISKTIVVTFLICGAWPSFAYGMESKIVWMKSEGWFAKYTQCLKYESSIPCKRYVPKLECIVKTNDGEFAFQVVRFYPMQKMDERWARGGYCGETFGCYPPYEIQFISRCTTKALPKQ
jgi:hypothetical protein